MRYKVGSECAGYNFKALHVSQASLDQEGCGETDIGAPNYEQSNGVVLVTGGSGGFDGLSEELKKTGLTHEIGHDLGLDDHYYQPTTPACRSDVDSIMEDWGCSTPNQFGDHYPTDHDGGDVRKAYEVGGVPWVNFVGVSDTDHGYFYYDTVNSGTHSVHNEQVTNGMRVRKKSSLEGSTITTFYQNRPPGVHSYSFNFMSEDGERCFSANGRNNYQLPTEGSDGSETCMNRQPIYYGKAVGTSDTQNEQNRDYFRLFNLTYNGTITGAQLTYTNGAFITWVTEAGQLAGTIRFARYGSSGALDLPKGAYQFRFNVSGTGPYIIQLGLDD